MPLYGCVFSLEAGAILRLDVYLCWKVIHSAAAIVKWDLMREGPHCLAHA